MFSTSPRKHPHKPAPQALEDYSPTYADGGPQLLPSTSAAVEAPFSRLSAPAATTSGSSNGTSHAGLRNRHRSGLATSIDGPTPPSNNGFSSHITDLLLSRLSHTSQTPESLDWVNVLLAQIINQYRADMRENGRLATVLNEYLNDSKRPDFLDEIKLTELSTGEDFPIFSNCRVVKRGKSVVVPVPADGSASTPSPVSNNGQDVDIVTEMDVDLSDTITLGIETRLLLKQPRIFSTVMPVSLVMSIVRFSARMILRISRTVIDDTSNPGTKTTALVLRVSFHPEFMLEVAVKSLLGSRSMLHDMPRIGHYIEGKLCKYFSDNFVEPAHKQVVLFKGAHWNEGDASGEASASG